MGKQFEGNNQRGGSSRGGSRGGSRGSFGGGNRGGFDQGPPSYVIPYGTFLHKS